MSIAHWLAIVVSTMALFAESRSVVAEPTAAQSADLKKMQEKWRATKYEAKEGINIEFTHHITVKVKEAKLEWLMRDESQFTYAFEIDSSKSPKQITFTFDAGGVKQIRRGIYSFDGEVWKLCWNHDNDAPRPTTISLNDSAAYVLLELKPEADASAEKPQADDSKSFETIRFDSANPNAGPNNP